MIRYTITYMIAEIHKKLNQVAKNTPQLIALMSSIMIGEIYIYNLSFISLGAYIAYTYIVGGAIGRHLVNDTIKQYTLGIVITLSITSLTGTGMYYIFGLSPLGSLISLLSPIAYLAYVKKTQQHKQQKTIIHPYHTTTTDKVLIYILCSTQVILILSLIHARNAELMPSPWQALSPWFFILFACTTALIILLGLRSAISHKIMLGITSVHLFIIYSVAAIVYRLGYGFDGFIHRVAENIILTNGQIAPIEPFYIGQYNLVVTLSRATNLSIHTIDIYLVPILASLAIPAIVYLIFSKIVPTSSTRVLTLSLVIPFLFFIPFHLTTPHNLTLLCTLITALLLYGYTQKNIPFIAPLSVSLVALATHPLLGAPLTILTLAARVYKHANTKKRRTFILFTIILALTFTPTLLFSIRMFLANFNFQEIAYTLIPNIPKFIELFERPFWFQKGRTLWHLDILYIWQATIIPLSIILALVGAWYQRKMIATKLLCSGACGLFLGAILLRSALVFPGVSSHEQGGYPMRLLVGAIILVTPLIIYAVYHITTHLYNKIKKYNTPSQISTVFALTAGAMLMSSLYLSYPQHNQKVRFPGYNITEYDKKTVQWIHEQHETYDYVVLSTIITAVSALNEYGFAHYFTTPKEEVFYYSIPSGGTLYLNYLDMLYEEDKRATIDYVFELTQASKVYVVVSWYWGGATEIIEAIKHTADNYHTIDDKMWIFEYYPHAQEISN